MCWASKTLTMHISDGKVKVFKVCTLNNNGEISGYYYKWFKYVLNQEYQTNINIHSTIYSIENQTHIGNEGFHSYSAKECLLETNNEGFDVYNKKTNFLITGYNSYTNIVVVEGYLPKGTTYYINQDGEIISDRIILEKITHQIEYVYNKGFQIKK